MIDVVKVAAGDVIAIVVQASAYESKQRCNIHASCTRRAVLINRLHGSPWHEMIKQ